jgi:hypothetical protein
MEEKTTAVAFPFFAKHGWGKEKSLQPANFKLLSITRATGMTVFN